MASVNPKNLVENYLNLRTSQKFDELNALLAEKVEYRSPLSRYGNSNELVTNMKRNAEGLTGLNLKKLFVDGDDVCAIYEQKSADPAVGEIVFTEWFTIESDRIAKIESTFDTSRIVKSRSQI